MKMSEEMAVRLHRMMWSDMQRELGDGFSCGRGIYKEEWLAKHFPGEHFVHDCFLCEYVMQQTGNTPLLGCADCKLCPIKWPGDNCSLREREGGVYYLQSPISEILALPARNENGTESPNIEKASNKQESNGALEKLFFDAISMLKIYQSALSCESNLPSIAPIADHIKAIKKEARTEGYDTAKEYIAECSGVSQNELLFDHIRAIKEKAVEEYFKKQPAAKTVSMDVDEQMASIFEELSKASGLSESNHDVRDHVDKIIEKTSIESTECTRKFMAKYSGEIWDRLTVVGHIEKIKKDANAKLNKYKDALSNQSGLDRDKPIDVHLREIVKISREFGAAEERDRIQEKIYEELLS